MYARLVVGGTIINVLQAMRDIGRLITSENPDTSLLAAFSRTSSVIVDNTPAGWTYVGSTSSVDQPSIAPTDVVSATTGQFNFCFSSPIENKPNLLKYAVLTNNASALPYTNANSGFTLTSATSATALGILTNEGPRYWTSSVTASYSASIVHSNFSVAAGKVFHVIATPRHLTIISEGTGMSGIWETSSTETHDFYGSAPFIQFNHYNASRVTQITVSGPTLYNNSTVLGNTWNATAFNVTDVNTGTVYGTYDVTVGGSINGLSLANYLSGLRANTVSSSGLPKYSINPIYFTMSPLGYATQFVTGVVPIYYVSGSLGNTGDTVLVNGDSYYFFNCGTNFGVVMKTS